jgi:cytosine/adenosine deaminase-related metal-dependent hydrolase
MILRADAVLPIAAPLMRPGWVEVDAGRIVRVGPGEPPGSARDLGRVAILPGLVNAHTHLELSWMADQVPPAASLTSWISQLIALRKTRPDPNDDEARQAAFAAAMAMRASGVVLAGDISNTLMSAPVYLDANLAATVFHEMLAFNPADPAAIVRDAWARIDRLTIGGRYDRDPRVLFSVVAHAPYSVAPSLFAEIVRHRRQAPVCIHLGESPEEIEFLRTGRGPIGDLIIGQGVWAADWIAPECDPVQYLDKVGYLVPGVIAVHAVHLTDSALETLRDAGAYVVTCPRSNEWVGAGLPRVSHFYGLGVPVAIGTDSLASAPSLSIFDELAELRRIAPDVAAASLLESATRIGADALGHGSRYGTIEAGKLAALIAVDLPARTGDVEEYLVSGVPPASVRHVSDLLPA